MIAALGAPPLLVANAEDAPTWRTGLACVPDVRRGAGSLGGIYTAIASGMGPVLCAGWDMPFLPQALLETLAEESEGFDAFLPDTGVAVHRSWGLEPLCAVYSPACLAPIERALADGRFQAISFHDSVRVGTLSLDRVRAFGDPAVIFFNVNRPEDLDRAEVLWQEQQRRK
jgi:molybdopterin-guanine dinucleotide biosynthesis protein A